MTDEAASDATETSTMLLAMLENAPSVFVKKLSKNDRSWAQDSRLHQAGIYVPRIQRDSGFFPPLEAKKRDDANAAPILEAYLDTVWPQFSETKRSHLINYTSKGAETHLTRLPKAAFSLLSPASYLIMARSGDAQYRCLTIDSASDEALLLEDILDLPADFAAEVLDPTARRAIEKDRLLDFADQVIAAWNAGEIERFARENASMPTTLDLALLARAQYLKTYDLADLNPYTLSAPGDAIREISRSVEWELFREYQRRERAVALVRLVLGDIPKKHSTGSLLRRLIDNVAGIDAIMLSASQQRKSRAGYSFEHHIESMLSAAGIPFEKQVVMEAKKRPDFVLPSLTHLRKPLSGAPRGLILSAKTTLRERWKQVQREMGESNLYLATVDENIAGNAITDMASLGIKLVVPESLKNQSAKQKITEYESHENVLSFQSFFALPEVVGRWGQP